MRNEAAVLFHQGQLALGRGDSATAEQLFERAHQVDPGHAEAWHMHGALALQRGDVASSLALLAQALHLSQTAQIHFNVGLALNAAGDMDQALAHMVRATELAPDWSHALNNAGVVLLECGRPEESVHLFERAVAADPNNREAASNYLLALQYLPDLSARDIASRHFEWAQRFWPRMSPNVQAPPARREGASPRLRIGFVSGDLCMHPVGLMLRNLLDELQTRPVDIYLYSNRERDDEVSRAIRACRARWRSIEQLDDAAAARLIRADQLDVLIDLSGHTAHNRLGVFTLRPCGVQVSWLGYGATTGLTCMDYVLADPHCASVAEQGLFSEQLVMLPASRLIYSPPDPAPEVSPLPALSTGIVTLGCFNNFAKINEAVVRCWAAILRQLPKARLLLKGRQYQSRACQRQLAGWLEAHQVGLERVLIEGHTSFADYLEAFGRVDFALDPFPFPGGATTLDGLWMGVPTLTLDSDRMIGRQGVSLMRNVGLEQWIARDEQHYVDLAVRAAAELDSLATLRVALRSRMLASPLCDSARFATDFLRSIQTLAPTVLSEGQRAV